MQSIWKQNCNIRERKPLDKAITADVAVIGAGMAGILTAYMLQQKGAEVVVIEAERIGNGQTKNTTAKITAQHGPIYHTLLQDFDLETAKGYYKANASAIQEYRRIVNEQGIDCMFEDKPAYLYSIVDDTVLQQEYQAAEKIGIPATMTTDTGLPFSVKSALRFDNQAQFHPLQFIQAISDNLQIYEHTMVEAIEETVLKTQHGSVTANKIVMATHYPFLNTPGFYFARMHQERSYVVAVEQAADVGGMYYGIDPDTWSFRNSGDLLLLGGGNHRTGENSAGGKYEALQGAAKRFYPNSNAVANWSAQDCMTLDGIPYIGEFAESTPNLYVATGFGKWGMTSSMVSAMLLSDLITGQENPFKEIFTPQRFKLSASAKNLMEEGTQAVKGLSRRVFTLPDTEISKLPNGHGGIVEYNGEKVGVYKDEGGKAYTIYPKCPHLGCQLEWNPDELSWDCPCHGSRFDYHGNLIDNPAMEGLERA